MTLRYVPYDICESAEKLERIYFHLISIEEHRLECLRLQHRKDWFKNQAAEREMELGQAVGKYIEELQKVSFEDLQMVSQARILIRKKEHPYSILSSKDRANPDLEIQAIMNVEEKVKQASREHEKTKEAQQMQEYTVPQRNQHRHR